MKRATKTLTLSGNTDLKVSAALFLVIFALFGRALFYDFVWDDYFFLVENDAVKDLRNIPSFFSQSSADLYRPFRTVLYSLMHAVFGLNPFWHHALGLLLHSMVSFLVFRMLVILGITIPASFFGAVIFAIHPVHIQKIVFITSGYDIPGDLFLVGAVNFYLLYRRDGVGRYAWLFIMSFATGLMFTETAAAFLPLLVMFEVLLPGPSILRNRKNMLYVVALLAIFMVYLVVRTEVIGRVARPSVETDYWLNLYSMMAVFVHYWKLLVIPYPLSPFSPFGPTESIKCVYCLLGLLLNATFIYIAWRIRKTHILIALGVFWFYMSISPNSNVIPTGSLMAERYLYLPSVGLCILIALCYQWTDKWKKPLAASAVIFFAALSLLQTGNWANGETLWKSSIKTDPGNASAYMSLAGYYHRKGEKDKAISVYKEMIKKDVLPEKAMAEIAAYLMDEQKYEEAERILAPLARLEPDYGPVAVNLIVARCMLDRPGWREEAERGMKNHKSVFLYAQVGKCYARTGMFEKAEEVFKEILEMDPYNAEAKKGLDLLRGNME